MCERFVFMPDELWQSGEKLLRANNDLVMVCLEGPRHQTRILELICFTFFERDRKCLNRLVHHPTHHRSDGRGVNTTRKEHSQRYVGHQAQTHRSVKEFAPFRDVIFIANAFLRMPGKTDIPVTTYLQLTFAPKHNVARQQTLDPAE